MQVYAAQRFVRRPHTTAPAPATAPRRPQRPAHRRRRAGFALRAAASPSLDHACQDLESCPRLAADYVLTGREVGRGSFALVLEARDLRTGELCCVKKLPKYKHQRLPCQQTAVVAAEAAALRVLSAACPASILRFHEVRQDTNYFYIVTELCLSDLSSYLARRGGRLSEREAAWILRQLLAALAACHRHGLAFRDVKPANLLLREVDAAGRPQVVLADFGCSQSVAGPQPSNRVSAGTPLYAAPETVHGLGGPESDVWAAGVLLFSLLSGGAFPFCDPRHAITQGEYWRRVAEQPMSFAGPAWHGVSPAAVALLKRMLERDCSRRITAAEALQDPWLLDMTSSTTPRSSSPRSSNVLPGAPRHAAKPAPAARPAVAATV